jgi:internalin A
MMRKITRTLWITVLVTFFSIFSVQALSPVKVGPVLVDSNPKNNMLRADPLAAITVKFKSLIKAGGSYSKITLKSDKNINEKILVSIKASVLNIKPARVLAYNTNYIVTIPGSSILDGTGTPLKNSISIKFRTNIKPMINNQKPVVTPKAENSTPAAIGTIPITEASTNRSLTLHAFYSGKTNYDSSAENYLKQLNSVSFAWLNLENQNGTVTLNGNNLSTDFHIPTDYSKPLTFCMENKLQSQIAIFSDGNTAKTIMADPLLKEDLIEKIIESLKMKLTSDDYFDFDGVVIDFEGFRLAETGDSFDEFLKDLKARLLPLNKKLYVAVNVRSYWPGYNYNEILKYADKVILMAHDYEPNSDLSKGDIQKYTNYNDLDPINTIAPLGRVRSDLEDLIGSINNKEDLKKIWLQFSFGITQWQFPLDNSENWTNQDNGIIGSKTNPTYAMLMSRIDNKDGKGTDITNGYINELESPFLTYYNGTSKTYNFIIYEDSRSIKAKIDLAKFEGIDGISIWRLGNVPDYNDAPGIKFFLNVFTTIFDAIKK